MTKDRFVVCITNSDGHKVCMLFNYWNLYQTTFYVEDDIDETNRCWYFGDDVDESMLPPKHQFPYVSVIGKGLFILPTDASYASIGNKNIWMSKTAIDGYIRTLYTIKNNMTRTGRKMNRLVIGEALEDSLKSGPLTFGPVGISEVSRFADYQAFAVDNIYMNVQAPLHFTQLFTHWSTLSKRLRSELGFSYKCLVSKEKVELTTEQVWAKVAILCNSIIDKE